MGRTYKRDPNQDDLDDPVSIDATDDDDSMDWMTRPNETRWVSAGRGQHRAIAGRAGYRTLPDDWQDFDYGADASDVIWR